VNGLFVTPRRYGDKPSRGAGIRWAARTTSPPAVKLPARAAWRALGSCLATRWLETCD